MAIRQRTTEEFTAQIRKLLPIGRAWNAEEGTVTHGIIRAIGQELSRVHQRAAELIEETDPATTLELLEEYERVWGLPEPCVGAVSGIEARRSAVQEKIRRTGGQSKAYIITVAAAAGYAITIDELPGNQSHTFRVNSASNTFRIWSVNSGVDEALRTWDNASLECIVNRVKRAGTRAIFAYSG